MNEIIFPKECLRIIGCVSLRKSKIEFFNPKESENGFCVSLLNRTIHGLPDHGASKEPKNPLWNVQTPGVQSTYNDLYKFQRLVFIIMSL